MTKKILCIISFTRELFQPVFEEQYKSVKLRPERQPLGGTKEKSFPKIDKG